MSSLAKRISTVGGILFPRITLAILLFLVAAHQAAAEPREIRVGFICTMKAEDTMRVWTPIIDDLSNRTGIRIGTKSFDDYAGAIWAMDAGKIQIALMGNKSAMEAVDRAGGEIALRKVELDGTDGYHSHLITHVDSRLNNLADVISRGGELTFGSGDPNSTSGFVVPNYYLFTSMGLDPKRIFKRITQANHQENLFAIADGSVDVATSNSVALRRFRDLYPEKYARVRVLWTSPLIASDPIVWSKSLPDEQKSAIRDFFLDYGRPSPGKSPDRLAHEREALGAITVSGFTVSSDRQLLPIREIELFNMRSRIENDPSIPPDQRTSRLTDIEARIHSIRQERIQSNP